MQEQRRSGVYDRLRFCDSQLSLLAVRAGVVGAHIDRVIETKGLDYIQAKHHGVLFSV
jgi:hypothetical protein